VGDAEACDKIQEISERVIGEIGETLEGEPFFTFQADAMTYRGVNASLQVIRMDRLMQSMSLEGDAEAEKVGEMMSAMFGKEGMKVYGGQAREYMMQVTGANAEERFKALVDRIKTKKRKRKKLVGLTADRFNPVQVGPGVYFNFDIKQMMTGVLGMIPADDKEIAEMNQFFGAIPDGAAELTGGARFEKDNLHLEFVVPLDLIKAIGEIAAKAAAAEAAKQNES
jgi:hypothetical protein